MRLSKQERDSLTRQIFEAVATVGFLTWKEQERQLAEGALAHFTAEQLRDHYFQEFEKTAWAEIREMAEKTSDERLYDTLNEWMEQAEAMALMDRDQTMDAQTKQPTKDLDIDLDR